MITKCPRLFIVNAQKLKSCFLSVDFDRFTYMHNESMKIRFVSSQNPDILMDSFFFFWFDRNSINMLTLLNISRCFKDLDKAKIVKINMNRLIVESQISNVISQSLNCLKWTVRYVAYKANEIKMFSLNLFVFFLELLREIFKSLSNKHYNSFKPLNTNRIIKS